MTRKEIVKALRECSSGNMNCSKCPMWDSKLDLRCMDFVMKCAADMLEQDAPGWISVKDRPPEMSGYYLVCTHNTFYDTYCISKVYFSGGVWGSLRKRYTNITHWMFLPELPKEAAK